jgi:hypothetical protein
MATQPLSSAPPPPRHDDAVPADAGRRRLPRELRTPSWLARLLAGGTTGNGQLTALTGTALVVLLAALGVTIVRIHPLLGPHMFIGMLLIGPLLLKLASTGYRFARYYTHDRAYVKKGPPPASLRILAPFVVVSTVVVFATGVALLLAGPSSRGALLPIHKVSFIVWVVFAALHVLIHLPDLPQGLRFTDRPADVASGVGDPGARELVSYSAGRSGRALSLAGAIVAGTVLALVCIPQFSPWLHAQHFAH